MLIPSIDLLSGRVVQLEQGERLALQSDDLDGWIDRFSRFPIVQVIDLDAAMGTGENRKLVQRVCAARACQVGGGIRTTARALELVEAGATRVIVGSSLFQPDRVDVQRAAEFARTVGVERLMAAVDSRGGRVVIHGWKTTLPISPVEAVRALEPFAGAFLYTHVDTEGMLTGLNQEAVLAVKTATSRRLFAAGGIRSLDEVDALDRLGIDAVVGMAIYTDLIRIQ